MNAQNYWQMFLETGSPEMFILYSQAKRMEASYVPDDQRIDITNHQLQ